MFIIVEVRSWLRFFWFVVIVIEKFLGGKFFKIFFKFCFIIWVIFGVGLESWVIVFGFIDWIYCYSKLLLFDWLKKFLEGLLGILFIIFIFNKYNYLRLVIY